jgi:hypothetical protein
MFLYLIQPIGILNLTETSYVQIRDGGSISCDRRGVLPAYASVEFSGNGRVIRNCPLTIGNLVIRGSVDVGNAMNIINTLKMTGNAQLVGHAPTYQPHSNLIYCSGGELDRSAEWSAMQYEEKEEKKRGNNMVE